MTSQLDMFARDVRPAAARTERSRARRQASTSLSETEMLAALQATGRYRILRKLEARTVVSDVRPGFPLRGVILDTETTGLDARRCEVIEIGLVAFTYNAEGEIGDVVAVYGGLQQPTIAIPPDITRLTGITDAMVAGQSIDIAAVQAIVGPADLIIAHNAGFDRPFCEALSDVFVRKAWACSVSEIDWSGRGFEGTKLGYLIGQSGHFHDGHRAVDDCFALLEVLEQSADGAKLPPFAELYKASQRSRVRIFAENAPFDLKDVLKARGYRWSDGSDGRPKSWWTEVAEEELEAELGFLRKEIYRWDEADPPTQRLTAFDRYRARR
ncbi:3'-5' exonuclease [Sinorhizobium meliloti]|uniref:3'-5' exonuclease n=1 Tax=Rhizobium meliloti TaxID=382 RepID=UPI00037155FD|nr:3'-5' exonuclease [Sinorhizobium meliloti]